MREEIGHHQGRVKFYHGACEMLKWKDRSETCILPVEKSKAIENAMSIRMEVAGKAGNWVSSDVWSSTLVLVFQLKPWCICPFTLFFLHRSDIQHPLDLLKQKAGPAHKHLLNAHHTPPAGPGSRSRNTIKDNPGRHLAGEANLLTENQNAAQTQ